MEAIDGCGFLFIALGLWITPIFVPVKNSMVTFHTFMWKKKDNELKLNNYLIHIIEMVTFHTYVEKNIMN